MSMNIGDESGCQLVPEPSLFADHLPRVPFMAIAPMSIPGMPLMDWSPVTLKSR